MNELLSYQPNLLLKRRVKICHHLGKFSPTQVYLNLNTTACSQSSRPDLRSNMYSAGSPQQDSGTTAYHASLQIMESRPTLGWKDFSLETGVRCTCHHNLTRCPGDERRRHLVPTPTDSAPRERCLDGGYVLLYSYDTR